MLDSAESRTVAPASPGAAARAKAAPPVPPVSAPAAPPDAPARPSAGARLARWLRRRWLLLLVAVLAVAGLGGWLGRPRPVPVEPAQLAPLIRTLVFTGRVSAESRVELGSTVTGRVVEVRVREGAQVRAGDTLVRLDDAEALAALRQAEANERVARARLSGQRELAQPTSEAAVAQAAATRRAAQAELDRTRRLVERGFLSAARLDEAQRALDVASAQAEAARAQAQAARPGGTDAAQTRLRLEEAAAAVQLAQARLSLLRVAAPADGLVLSRTVEPGMVVQPGRVLLTMSVAAPVQLVAQADEKFLAELVPGQHASVVADAFPQARFDATIRSIAPMVDAQRGAVEVKFAVPEPPAFLRNDMTLSIEVQTARRPQAITVPAQAVRVDAAGAAIVRVVRDGTVVELPVRTGVRTLERVEIVEGLGAGEPVVTDPVVQPGGRVRAVDAARLQAERAGVSVRTDPMREQAVR